MKNLKNLFTLFLFGGLVLAFSCEKDVYTDDANDNSTRNEIDEEAENEEIDTEPIDSSMWDGPGPDTMLFDYDLEVSSSGGTFILTAQCEDWWLRTCGSANGRGFEVYDPETRSPSGDPYYWTIGTWGSLIAQNGDIYRNELLEYSFEFVSVKRISTTEIEATVAPNTSRSSRYFAIYLQLGNLFKAIDITQD